LTSPKAIIGDLGIGAGVGTMSGALGVGGGILLVPYLVLRRSIPQKRAQATSLVMVGLAAGAGAITYALASQVAWIPAAAILVGGLVGSFTGSHLVQRTADRWLQGIFGFLLMIAAARMLWPTSDAFATSDQLSDLQPGVIATYLITGLGMGLLSAMFGIGGGILLVPVLVAFLHYTPQLAAGTSLAVMLPIALFGAYRQTKPGLTDWKQGSIFGLGSIVGAVVGASLAMAASATIVRLCFAAVLLAVGIRYLVRAWRTSQARPASLPS
jgi:uncharacterized membrane protein YfcA